MHSLKPSYCDFPGCSQLARYEALDNDEKQHRCHIHLGVKLGQGSAFMSRLNAPGAEFELPKVTYTAADRALLVAIGKAILRHIDVSKTDFELLRRITDVELL